MKKIITLIVLLTGIVGMVKADDVNIRIYAQRESNWGSDVYVYVNYYNGSNDVFLCEKQMDWIVEASSGNHMFYTNLAIDKSLYDDAHSKYGIKIKFHNGNGTWTYSYNEIDDFTKNYIFYIKKGDNYYQEYNTFDYKFAKYASSTLNDAITLSPSNNVLTTVVDNESSVTEATYVLYPSFAVDYGSPLKWELAISPVTSSGDFDITSFINYEDDLEHQASSNRGFYVNSVKAKNTFTFDLTNERFTVSPHFERTLPVAAEGYATFSSEYSVTPDATLTSVRYASAVDASGNITWSNYGDLTNPGILAGQGALLEGTAGNTYKFTPVSTTPSTPTTNLLKPITTKQQITQTTTIESTTYYNYILTNKKYIETDPYETEGPLGFYKPYPTGGSWCAAGTAYLQTTYNATSPARDYFPLVDESSSVESILNETKNANRPVYDLQGRCVTNPQKGLYIVDGKKVVIK